MFERFKKPTYIELPKGFLAPPFKAIITTDCMLKPENIQKIESDVEDFISGKKKAFLIPEAIKELLIFDNSFKELVKIQRQED